MVNSKLHIFLFLNALGVLLLHGSGCKKNDGGDGEVMGSSEDGDGGGGDGAEFRKHSVKHDNFRNGSKKNKKNKKGTTGKKDRIFSAKKSATIDADGDVGVTDKHQRAKSFSDSDESGGGVGDAVGRGPSGATNVALCGNDGCRNAAVNGGQWCADCVQRDQARMQQALRANAEAARAHAITYNSQLTRMLANSKDCELEVLRNRIWQEHGIKFDYLHGTRLQGGALEVNGAPLFPADVWLFRFTMRDDGRIRFDNIQADLGGGQSEVIRAYNGHLVADRFADLEALKNAIDGVTAESAPLAINLEEVAASSESDESVSGPDTAVVASGRDGSNSVSVKANTDVRAVREQICHDICGYPDPASEPNYTPAVWLKDNQKRDGVSYKKGYSYNLPSDSSGEYDGKLVKNFGLIDVHTKCIEEARSDDPTKWFAFWTGDEDIFADTIFMVQYNGSAGAHVDVPRLVRRSIHSDPLPIITPNGYSYTPQTINGFVGMRRGLGGAGGFGQFKCPLHKNDLYVADCVINRDLLSVVRTRNAIRKKQVGGDETHDFPEPSGLDSKQQRLFDRIRYSFDGDQLYKGGCSCYGGPCDQTFCSSGSSGIRGGCTDDGGRCDQTFCSSGSSGIRGGCTDDGGHCDQTLCTDLGHSSSVVEEVD